MNVHRNRVRARVRGASLIEFVIVVPLFAFLIAGIFEVALMYRTKALVHAATFEAAQQGALNNALQRNIDDGFAQGMMPLYLRSRSAAGVAQAYARTRAALVLRTGRVQIVSPTRDVFNRFRETRLIRQPNGREQRVQVIPNDNLMWRTASMHTISNAGPNPLRMNVQDANILKVRSYWCYRLLTPLLDRVIWTAASGGALGLQPRSDEQRACDLQGLAGGYYIAMTSSAVTRMQSPAYVTNLP